MPTIVPNTKMQYHSSEKDIPPVSQNICAHSLLSLAQVRAAM